MSGQISLAILALGMVVKKRGIAHNEVRFLGPPLTGPLMHLNARANRAESSVFTCLLCGFVLQFNRVDFRQWEALCQHKGKHARPRSYVEDVLHGLASLQARGPGPRTQQKCIRSNLHSAGIVVHAKLLEFLNPSARTSHLQEVLALRFCHVSKEGKSSTRS